MLFSEKNDFWAFWKKSNFSPFCRKLSHISTIVEICQKTHFLESDETKAKKHPWPTKIYLIVSKIDLVLPKIKLVTTKINPLPPKLKLWPTKMNLLPPKIKPGESSLFF